ncbi:Gfo/Idh/MocA family protein [Paraburkholderia sp. EG287B]|uniref:Gfo/Idh/MocA family protein n=1 Tax=Paraburkholderia sp. EG287B TaxID=3237010 RepID=UPI0034D1BAF5
MRREIGVGVIGTGFMGKAHALAYRAVPNAFPESVRPRLVAVADVNEAGARQAQEQFGFERATTDWKSLLTDDAIKVISITTPCSLHREMALAAIAAGKHVHCEKPIAPSSADALAMAEAAAAAGTVTQVGYNYIKNPMLALARQMIAEGELGAITSFRGVHAEDYMADPEIPYGWRVDPENGAGALAEIGNHIIGLSRFLLGPIEEVTARLETVNKTRPVAPGARERRTVNVDDIARLMVTFARGCSGTLEANWAATGRKMQLEFEVYGTRGALVFSQERFNELHFYRGGDDPRTSGFTRIEAGPAHPPYANFTVAGGHQLGFNDLKTIEMAGFLDAIDRGGRAFPDFQEAWEIQRVVDSAVQSSVEGRSIAI